MLNAARTISGLLICCLSLFAADKVILKNNTTLEGEIVRDLQDEDEVVVATATKNVSVARSDIAALKRDEAAHKELAERRAKIEPLGSAGVPPAGRSAGVPPAPEKGLVIGPRAADGQKAGGTPALPAGGAPALPAGGTPALPAAEAHFALYSWAQAQRLYGAAQEELLATLISDPNHAAAHKALGNVYRDGQWCAAAEARTPGPEAVPAATKLTVAEEKAAYYAQVARFCKLLAPGAKASEDEKRAAASELARERSRAGEMLACCLAPVNQPEPATRLGALKGLELLKPAGAEISYSL
ncbi:MAG: hypothetical protein ABSE73_14875, partial [Planctomycetota bacterium]